MGTSRVEVDRVIDAPVESVWEFLSDPRTIRQWDLRLLDVKWQPPVGVGTTLVLEAQLVGRGRRTANVGITAWEPNRRIGFETRFGGVKANTVIAMNSIDGYRTKLSISSQAEIGGLLKLIQPYISYRVRKDRSAAIDRIKRILETKSKSA
jgi:uncharacterized protein YndB with AHSA1/START domain